MADNETAISKVAHILGVKKAAWSRVGQCRKEAMEDGFTDDDFIARTDKNYHSIYSVFLKTDYWLNQTEPEQVKGVW